MKSIDKLKRLTGETRDNFSEIVPVDKAQSSSSLSPDQQSQLRELRRRIETIVSCSRRQDKASTAGAALSKNLLLAETLAGCEGKNEHGSFFFVSKIFGGASRHGHRVIDDFFPLDTTAAALLANNADIGNYCGTDALFLDTETTGLSGGTGTLPFLIGLGWFEGEYFHIRQILARDFSEEKAALSDLKDIIAEKKFLVTFNGKSFDVSLLTARFILNRLNCDLAAMPHLDLLHPSRRILGHRLENSRLTTIEEQILGLRRKGDIPGWEIPQRYFDWLKRRDPRFLIDIFEHNRLDVVSLAALTNHLTEILTARDYSAFAHDDDYLAAASMLITRSQAEAVAGILNIFQKRNNAACCAQSRKKLGEVYKRAGRLNEAVQIWQELTDIDPRDFHTVCELAKWLEHSARDYARAKMLVERALDSAFFFSLPERESLSHRLRRLEKKLTNKKKS